MSPRSRCGSRPAALAKRSTSGYQAWSHCRRASGVRSPRYSHWQAIGRTASTSTPAASRTGSSR
eukprot:2907791-Alexandrium_andersonii.AAC.1